ncbi:hypothetical protein TNCV_3797331 [Trichonephila clavipes]|nr:hypothetical protein TNCV_3797331 [Trichonephila clavipes]
MDKVEKWVKDLEANGWKGIASNRSGWSQLTDSLGRRIKIMFDPSSFVNPTPLAHADASRDVFPRGGTSRYIRLAEYDLFCALLSIKLFRSLWKAIKGP